MMCSTKYWFKRLLINDNFLVKSFCHWTENWLEYLIYETTDFNVAFFDYFYRINLQLHTTMFEIKRVKLPPASQSTCTPQPAYK